MSLIRIKLSSLAPLLVLSGCLFFFSFEALGCPNCKNAKLTGKEAEASRRMSEGYFWSYLGMSSMPFLLVSGIGGMLFLSNRQQQARRREFNQKINSE